MIGTVEICCFRLVNQQLEILLKKRRAEPFHGCYSLIGGGIQVEKDATMDDTVVRILDLRAGLSPDYFEQVSTVANANRDPRSWSICCLHLCLVGTDQMASGPNEWINLNKVLSHQVGLAFDHYKLICMANERLVYKSQYTCLPVYLLKPQFTLPEFQQSFETVLNSQLPKAAFRRRIERSEILVETGEMDRSQNRPATLYRLKKGIENYHFDQLMKGNPSNAPIHATT